MRDVCATLADKHFCQTTFLELKTSIIFLSNPVIIWHPWHIICSYNPKKVLFKVQHIVKKNNNYKSVQVKQLPPHFEIKCAAIFFWNKLVSRYSTDIGCIQWMRSSWFRILMLLLNKLLLLNFWQGVYSRSKDRIEN